MKKNLEDEKNNNQNVQETEIKKIRFFKKVWYSITKLEKYSELSAQGLSKAIKYVAQLAIIMAIVSSIISVYGTKKLIDDATTYISENSPNFEYKDEVLTINSEEEIIDENTSFGKIILDIKTESEEDVKKYLDDISKSESSGGILILKNKLIIRQSGIEDATYEYKQLFEQLGISEFNKQDLIDYLKNDKMYGIYVNLFAVLALYAVIIYFINTILNVFIISVFGYIATLITKLKIRYVAVFNMAVYSITLSTILNIIYMIINAIFKFKINYFDLMYVLVSSIYMIAAIFILKTDFTKKQEVIQKIVEVQKQVHDELKSKEKEKNEHDGNIDNKNNNEEDNENNESKEDNNIEGEESEGANA